MKNILIINGPNLNLLGEREPEIYGSKTLDEINRELQQMYNGNGLKFKFFQSNSEGSIIDKIQQERKWMHGLVINPASYSHTSIGIMDALAALKCPIVEVHLSNIHAREAFRHKSYVSKVATGVICGLGSKGYQLAVDALREL